jgi:ubiquinone/menaquinone biosynthesis C-methylase UbiE
MNHSRVYEYRFQNVDLNKKQIVWKELSQWLYNNYLNRPSKILDSAGGMCEFINLVPSEEKWAIDIEEDFIKKYASKDIKIIIGSNLNVELPNNYFNGIFISNFLEHLNSQGDVTRLLDKMYNSMAEKGRIAIMGPNFKYAFQEYFDFADHTLALSELGIAEYLYGSGFKIVKIIPRFFPLSFRSGSILPVNSFLIKTYLNLSFAWKIFGKQFLVIGEK